MKLVVPVALGLAVVAAGCGSTHPRTIPVSHAVPRPVSLPACPTRRPQVVELDVAAFPFVRPGAAGLRICRYRSFNAGPSSAQLAGMRVIRGRRTIATLTRQLNALPELRKGDYHCPLDDGKEVLLVFGYSHARPERVVVELSGCRFATNGRSSRQATVGLLALDDHP